MDTTLISSKLLISFFDLVDFLAEYLYDQMKKCTFLQGDGCVLRMQ